MKQLYVLLALQIIWGGVNAQQLTPCDTANLDSSLDLTGVIFTNVVTTSPISYAKNPLPSLFRDVKYVGDAYGKPPGCTAPENDECLNDASALVFTVTYPKDHDYATCPLKAIVLMHAGGFGKCSSYDQYLIKALATLLAGRGFVVYNVEYRRGIDIDTVDNNKYTSVQQYKAPYIAEQDIKGFFRSMIKRERNKSQFNDEWRIDTNNIYMGGTSAGAYTALNVAIYDNAMINALYAPPIASGNIQYALGSPDVDFYYGKPDLDFYTFYQPKIKGICSMWGAIPMPYNPYNQLNQQPVFFANAHLVPAILFHGYKDIKFPLLDIPKGNQNVYLSGMQNSLSKYNSTTFCIRND
ncbi:MAG: hypothetical protein JST21_06085 [Bacteroidetes bacterium]|nr:hypothetical protein [Bacteroidota bacterium]